MKKILLIAFILFIVTSSFIASKNTVGITSQEETILQKVANANGFQNWKNVNEIKFTFNVDRDTSHFERSWTWKPKTNDVISTSTDGTIAYNRADMDSIANKINGNFINDKFWLLSPYQLAWDAKNVTHTHKTGVVAPLSKKTMQKLTIVYGNEGGYTPGDAYDFYFGDDLIVQEWIFRRGNQAEPSMITTFEDYKMFNGLNIATIHQMDNGKFKLYFTGVEVK